MSFPTVILEWNDPYVNIAGTEQATSQILIRISEGKLRNKENAVNEDWSRKSVRPELCTNRLPSSLHAVRYPCFSYHVLASRIPMKQIACQVRRAGTSYDSCWKLKMHDYSHEVF